MLGTERQSLSPPNQVEHRRSCRRLLKNRIALSSLGFWKPFSQKPDFTLKSIVVVFVTNRLPYLVFFWFDKN